MRNDIQGDRRAFIAMYVCLEPLLTQEPQVPERKICVAVALPLRAESDTISLSGAQGISRAPDGKMTGKREQEKGDTITILMYDFKAKSGIVKRRHDQAW
jgi:hypothetical protein